MSSCMKFRMIEGHVITVSCAGCHRTIQAGTVPYMPANGSKVPSYPETVYREESGDVYCSICAEGHATAQDETRSVTCYYSDTAGNEAT